MEMKKIMRKVSCLISFGNGLVLGAVFSAIAMARSPQGIIPMGVITSAILSALLSVIIGLLIPMKNVTDKAYMKCGVNPAKDRIRAALIEGLVGDFIFTPLLCTFFVVKNIIEGRIPEEVPKVIYWLRELGIDLLIALPITMIMVPLLRKLAFKIFKVGVDKQQAVAEA
ncbi:MAG: hypothetical protein J6Y08_09555 [Clostridiales bacterium]|nr:hypothetical protein [Clostridiales bacterium]